MSNKFHPNNIVTFKLNDIPYALHQYILDKLDIFKVIEDCPNEMINLIWNISPENAEIFFSIIVNDNYDIIRNNDNCIAKCVQIISFAKYVGIDTDDVRMITWSLLHKKTIVEYIRECDNLQYDNTMSDMFNIMRKDFDKKSAGRLIPILKSSNNFPIKFKFDVMFELLKYDLLRIAGLRGLAISQQNLSSCDQHDMCAIDKDNVFYRIFENYGFPIQSHSIHYSKRIFKNDKFRIRESTRRIFIDDVEIKSERQTSVEILAEHISKLILNI